LIDFDPKGLDEWYEQVGSKCIGWEEFYHYNGNATFDDDTTAGATRFLLRLYTKTLDPKYRPALIRALNFILQAQYPNGGWPQRYPLSHDFPHDGHPDYTSFYTFNDEVISNNIYLLLEAYERFGNEEYRQAARRGMDFYILSQRPRPQAGWAQQYDMDMNPAWARSYEPPALMTGQTMENIRDLEKFYLITGDRRYLEPIPGAIQWLKDSVINTDPSKNFTHAIFYEPGTNQAIYPHDEHRKNASGKFEAVRFYVDKNPDKEGERPLYSRLPRVDIPSIEKEFKRISSLKHEEGKQEYESQKERARAVTTEEIRKIISSLDARGAWITDIEFLDTLDWIHNPPTRFRGIDVRIYSTRIDKLIRYLKSIRKG
jgi:PelA/Pel-15E family pectate lyase